jgi:HEAT repeat protein
MTGRSSDYVLMERALTSSSEMAALGRHPSWRVRYAAAIGMGETSDPAWLNDLRAIMALEEQRDLYGQPPVREFVGGYDDTRAAELLAATEAVWDTPPTPEQYDAWQCRGRVRQACILAVAAIGVADEAWLQILHTVLRDPREDFVVKTAAAKALQRVGTTESLPHLAFALALDEWCLSLESRKAIVRLTKPSTPGALS